MKKLVDAIERIIDPPVDRALGEEAESYLVQANVQAGTMRVILYDMAGVAVGHFECSAPGAYELSEKILRAYDKLEGIA